MIELKKIVKSYHQHTVLNQIDLHIPEGSIFGIIGKSGAGKSTLLRCINRLEQADRGQVLLDGVDLNTLSKIQMSAQRQKMGMIFQHFNLLRSKTVYDNIALALEISGAQDKSYINTLLSLTGLSDKAQRYPSELSGGQKQRVAIARALVNHPKVLLCDEATSALDPESTGTILDLLKSLKTELGLTIVLITHEMDVIKRTCDQVALLDQGKLLETSSVLEFFTHPKTEPAKILVSQSLTQEAKIESDAPLWRIMFAGKTAGEPIISHLVKELGIELNILQANIEWIQDQPLGVMTLGVIGDSKQQSSARDYLEKNNVIVESLSE